MNSENIMTMSYKDLKLEYCIFENQALYVGRYLLDTREYDVAFQNLELDIELLPNKHFLIKNKTDDELSYGCLNAMIYYLEINIFRQHIGYLKFKNDVDTLGDVGNYSVYKIKEDNYLFLDLQTIQDLKLTDDFFFKINYTKTIFGRQKLKKAALFPLKTKKDILQRHNQIAELRNKNTTTLLKKIKNVESNGLLDIFQVPNLLKNFISIAEELKDTSLRFKNLDLFKNIYNIIDIFEVSDLKKGLFPSYDHLINLYNNLPNYLSDIASNIIQDTDLCISIIYIPQLGYLIEADKNVQIEDIECNIYHKESFLNIENDFMKSSLENQNNNNTNFVDFFESRVEEINSVIDNLSNAKSYANIQECNSFSNFTSTKKKKKSKNSSIIDKKIIRDFTKEKTLDKKSGDQYNNHSFIIKDKIYYKNNIMNLLDVEIGDLNNLIQEYKNVKVNEIRKLIEKYSLDSIYEYIGLVDCINSLSLFSIKNKCCIPKISDNNKIEIKNYWNYQIDISIEKSLIYKDSLDFLKIIGEIAILFHMGSHLPSTHIEMFICDKIYTSIDIKENINTGTSYFLACIKSIARIVHSSTKYSLCLIGDFGFGTDYFEGLSLFYAIHKYMAHAIIISSCTFPEIFDQHKKLKDISSMENIPERTIEEIKLEDCTDCLCKYYNFYVFVKEAHFYSLILFEDNLESKNFLDDVDISDELKKEYLKNLQIVKKAKNNPKVDTWARKIINEFLNNKKNEI